jgi:nucleoside-diphosphate-sugar epimerase
MNHPAIKGKVLLTGISGFLGAHMAIHLLENGMKGRAPYAT